jgi:subtilisin
VLFGIVLTTFTVEGTISVQPAFSQSAQNMSNLTSSIANVTQSILQNSTEGSKIASGSPTIKVEQGKPIQIIPNSFIVVLKRSEVGALEETVGALTADLATSGGNVSAVYDQLGMFNVKFEAPQAANATMSSDTEQFIDVLKANPAVEAVYNDANVTIQAQVIPNDQNRVDADLSPTKSGDEVGMVDADIAVIDTGAQSDHPDLNVFKCVSFVGNPTPNVPLDTCADGNGHGTHVSGTAAALDNNIGIVGKAPGARVWAIKVLSDTGSGSFSDILEGLNYVASHSNEIDVVNMSLGGGGSSVPLETAVTSLVNNNGVVVVVAAGNSHEDANNFTPARTPAAITVSAVVDSNGKCGGGGPPTSHGPDDSFATFSNFGSVVDIAAPGVDVYSTYKDGGYATMSGTSMASPNVAGAAALYKSLNPSATPAQVDAFLKSTATKAPASGDGLLPCDGNGRGYFTSSADGDEIREPLLYMTKWEQPVCPQGPLTGHWKANDGGRYYIRQCGNTVWWAGMSDDGSGSVFTNVYKGYIRLSPQGLVGKNIIGQWCDVPRGTIMSCGNLVLHINSLTSLDKVSFTGGFGASAWSKIP